MRQNNPNRRPHPSAARTSARKLLPARAVFHYVDGLRALWNSGARSGTGHRQRSGAVTPFECGNLEPLAP